MVMKEKLLLIVENTYKGGFSCKKGETRVNSYAKFSIEVNGC